MVNNRIWLMNAAIKLLNKRKPTMLPLAAYLEVHDTRKLSAMYYEMKIDESGIVYGEIVI
jgi:hypothetical protein